MTILHKDDLLNHFSTILPKERILTGRALGMCYDHIWRMDKPLNALAVLLPVSTEEVSAILTYCHEHGQEVVVHGGRTGLVGSTRVAAHQVVISLEKLNHIEPVDESSRTITVGAGVLLEQVISAAKDKGLLFPLNFGAKGSAQIGGVLSTNAGGLRVLKFGMAREQVLGLEVVLPNGRILSHLKTIIKDNSGYDLKQLFIGSEGTLGVITKAVLKLREAPKSRNSAWIGINGYAQVVRFFKYIDRELAGGLSAYELVWRETFETMTGSSASVASPLPHDYDFYILVECLGSHQDQDRERLVQLIENAMADELVLDAAIAFTESDLEWFWKIREDVRVLSAMANNDQHFDISLPIPLIGDYVQQITAELHAIAEVENVFVFGHMADGNIHLVIGKSNASTALKNQINDIVYAGISQMNGSVSAEHGIGLDKKAYLHHCQTATAIDIMKGLKLFFDPKGILNPGRVVG